MAASFLRCGLVDALEWFRAPILIGGEGRPGIGALAVAALAEGAPLPAHLRSARSATTLWERYRRGSRMFTGIITDVGRVREKRA